VNRHHLARTTDRRHLRWLLSATLALLLVLPAAAGNAAPPDHANRDRELTVMSRNLYLGAELGPLIAASGQLEVLAAVRTVWDQVQATNYPERAKALADEIVENAPLLVGLQEVTTYRVGPVNDPAPAETVVLDFLDILLAELAARGAPYRALVSIDNFDGELPYIDDPFNPTVAFDLRLTDRDVIIARADVPASQLRVLGTDSGNFDTALELPIGGVLTPIERGWVSADVTHRGQTFRFVNTHPEAFGPPAVNAAQIAELVAGPLDTSLPVVLVGDLNAEPDTPAMAQVFAAGFEDTAVTATVNDPGDTCCFDADVRSGSLDKRIDYVLYRGAFEAVAQRRVGHLSTDRTPSGLYPSDHAGVAADFILPPGLSAPGRAGR
jgi:hypothetical protein